MRALVTGGSGRLARALGAVSDRIVSLPRSRLDVTDSRQVDRELAEGGYSVVLNAAGVSSLEVAEAEPETAWAANVVGPGQLAAACTQRGIPLIHISTDYVFGAPTNRPWKENDPVSPLNAYGRSKAEGEARVAAMGPTNHIVRVAWLFGDAKDFISQLLRTGANGSVTIAHDQVGCPTPLSALAARLLILCRRLSDGDCSVPQILHLAGSPPVSRADWVLAAFRLLEESGISTPHVMHATLNSFVSSAKRPNFSALDCSLAESIFGSGLDWRAGLEDCVRGGLYRETVGLDG